MKATKEHGEKAPAVTVVDEQELRSQLSEVVGQSVEEALNGLLDAEADALR